LNRKYVDYYYGVRPSEATATRHVYDGKSSIDPSVGATVTWRLDERQSIRGDVGITKFGTGITDSPLVGKKTAPSILVGYVYRFK
jgi:outer membrane protein